MKFNIESMKNICVLIAFILGVTGSIFAREVPRDIAEKVARNFYYQHANQIRTTDYQAIDLKISDISTKNNQQTMYAFDVNDNEGFVVVSGENSVKPVLAYAFKGEFNSDNMSPGQADMLDWYSKQIAWASQSKLTADEKTAAEWNELINYSPERGLREIRNIEPLMMVEWNQGWPYNAMCPEDAASPANGHVYVGCVATAMVQVMKHWNYPESGTGSYTHSNWWNGGYGNITVNFATKTYNWEGMPLKASGENDEMAEINFHAGVAVQMYWGPDGSGTTTSKVPGALVNYFKYDDNCQLISKDYYSETEYKNILKAQLDNKLPMVYSGSPSSGAGHAWNCDGYMDDEFHMNWGWGGAGNGYYTLDNLVSSATPGGDDYNFIYGQDAVINIYPEDNYPVYCSDNTVISHQGAFGDGSAEKNYTNNLNCEHLISPECGNLIRLKFEKFDLGEGDVVTIYDGTSTSGTLLGTYDADNLPGSNTINANSGNMLIRFQTDGSSTGDGWYVSFDTDYCASSSYYTEESGTVSDGSGTCQYAKSTVCFWHIEPEGAEAVKLNFTEFDLAEGLDYITIYENSTSTPLETYDSDNVPETVIVNAPKAIILFYANSDDNVAGGWSADYQSTESDIETNNALYGVSVYPNPASETVNLAFSLTKPDMVNIRIYDMLGKTLHETQISGQAGYQKLNITNMMNFPESGMYFIDVKAEGKVITKKISLIK